MGLAADIAGIVSDFEPDAPPSSEFGSVVADYIMMNVSPAGAITSLTIPSMPPAETGNAIACNLIIQTALSSAVYNFTVFAGNHTSAVLASATGLCSGVSMSNNVSDGLPNDLAEAIADGVANVEIAVAGILSAGGPYIGTDSISISV